MKREDRPWGHFKLFVLNKKCTAKYLEIRPNQELSLQKHKKRKEMWYFLTPGIIQVGNKKKNVKEGDIININKNIKHRIRSKNKEVKILEISFGHFDERDEIRIEDKYGRK